MIKKIIYILMLGATVSSFAPPMPTATSTAVVPEEPTATASVTAMPTMTMTASPTPTATAMPTMTMTATATATATAMPTMTMTVTASPTATATSPTGAGGYGQDDIAVEQPVSACPVSGTGGSPGTIVLSVTNNGSTNSDSNNCDRLNTAISSSGGAHAVIYGGASPGAGALAGSNYNAALTYGGTQIIGLDLPGVMLLLPAFTTSANYMIRSVANGCPSAGYFNWMYVEKPGAVTSDPLYGVVYNTGAAAYITDEWTMNHTPVFTNQMVDMGSGACSSGYQYTSNSNIEETGTGVWSTTGMGAYWSLSSRNGTISVPRATYIPANYASRRYAGMMSDSGGAKTLNTNFWYTTTTTSDGLSFTTQAVDPRSGSAIAWSETFTLSAVNNPAQGFLRGNSSRTAGNWLCLHLTSGSNRFIGCLGPNMAVRYMRSSP